MKQIKIALVGNPNCGKTTLFNMLTGSNQRVGNWPGVTVEKKEGYLTGRSDYLLADLPGIYSLSPYTLEEVISRDYVIKENPNLIINIVDGTCLERSLYLTTQLLELGIPIIMVINMLDVIRKRGYDIDLDKLSERFHCNVVAISALKGEGVKTLCETIDKSFGNQNFYIKYDGVIEPVLKEFENALPDTVPARVKRWCAIKQFERDSHTMREYPISAAQEAKIKAIEDKRDNDSESLIVESRYNFIEKVLSDCYFKTGGMTTTDKIDLIITNRWFSLPIFVLIMTGIYYISVTTIGALVTDFTNDTLFGEWICGNLEKFFEAHNVNPILAGLINDGIIGGVGAVLGFVPQMFVLFFLLSLVEECGYMARIAFILDRIFRRFGLSGKSFIPMLIGTGCSVPGIMASRTIENPSDRHMTIMTTPFIPCGAKMPVIALIAGGLFHGAWWVAPAAYFLGVISIILSGLMLKKTKPFAGETTPFVMELPDYHLPYMGSVFKTTWERGFSFIKKAGTIILAAAIIVWFLSRFGFVDGSFGLLDEEQLDLSLIAFLGRKIAPIFKPLGFANWQSSVATILGLVAKEEVVSVFGVLYGVSEEGLGMEQHFTMTTAFSFMVFNLLCAPCFAAIGAIRREMNNYRWTIFAIAYQTIFAYVMAFIIYHISAFFVDKEAGASFVIAVFLAVAMLIFALTPQPKNSK